jgi:hypothetical protein
VGMMGLGRWRVEVGAELGDEVVHFPVAPHQTSGGLVLGRRPCLAESGRRWGDGNLAESHIRPELAGG